MKPLPINDSDIAIIGMSCRFPGAPTIEKFRENLENGVESITFFSDEELIASGVDPAAVAASNYIKASPAPLDIALFDAEFFGFTPAEARMMDPQHRIFLECAWEALEDAGCIPGTKEYLIGVYAGSAMNSYFFENVSGTNDPSEPSGLAAIISNEKDYLTTRVSYRLDLRGPAVAIQTACSTSLVAVHVACQNLLDGECHIALAGGVTVRALGKAGYFYQEDMILSPDGHCRTFDAEAKGTLFGSGAGVVVLKSLERALADGDNVHAVIKGSAINNDGSAKVGYTAPSVEGQAAVISEAQAIADVDPESISYIEAHGTATALGDPIEIAALTRAFRQGTGKNGFCAIGSVKTNFGHLETAAGIAGLIKTVLALKNRRIPPSLHFKNPNPNIDFANSPFFVNTSLTDWESDGPRRAGVSSFGMGGTNAHVVLEEAPVVGWGELANPNKKDVSLVDPVGVRSSPQSSTAPMAPERPFHLLTLSAKTEPALRELAESYANWLAAHPEVPLADVCFTAYTGRSHFEHRLAVVAESSLDAQNLLRANDYILGKSGVEKPKTVFLFTGQGSEYPDMGRQLYETEPLFRETIDRCDAILGEYDVPLLELLYPDDGGSMPEISGDMRWLQPVLFSLEYALAELWQSWGIKPDVVMGHSIGEYVAACVAGVFSLEDALKLVANRGRLMQSCEEGRMLAVSVSEERALELIAPFGDDVSVATINAPESVVVSGRPDAINAVLAAMSHETGAGDGMIDTKLLPIPRASHSPLMEPVLDEFREIAASVSLSKPKIALCSNVKGVLVAEEVTDPAYWARHLREPVRFAKSIETLHGQGFDTFLEIGPKPALLGMAGQCLPASADDTAVAWIPSLREGQEDGRQMLEGLGRWHIRGGAIDWHAFDGGADGSPDGSPNGKIPRRKVQLPTYPFQRQRYWIEKARLARRGGHDGAGHPLLGRRFQFAGRDDIGFEAEIDLPSLPWLTDHRVFDAAVLPGTGYLEMALAAGMDMAGADAARARHAVPLRIQNVAIEQALILPEEEAISTQLVLSPMAEAAGSQPPAGEIWSSAGKALHPAGRQFRFQVFSRGDESHWTSHASGELAIGGEGAPPEGVDLAALKSQCPTEISAAEHYQNCRERGLNYGPGFQGVTRLFRGEGMVLGELALPESLHQESGSYRLHPALLDAAFQAGLWAVSDDSDESSDTYMPVGIKELQVYGSVPPRCWALARIAGTAEDGMTMDVSLWDEAGAPIAGVTGLAARRVAPETIARHFRKKSDALYELAWREQEIDSAGEASAVGEANGSWLILADRGGLGEELAGRLEAAGNTCILAYADTPASSRQGLPGPSARDGNQQGVPITDEEMGTSPGSALARPTPEGGAFAHPTENAWLLDPTDPAAFGRLLADAFPPEGPPLAGMVYLWALDAPASADLTDESLMAAQHLVCGGALHLVQAAMEQGQLAKLWLVTRNAVAAVGEEGADLAQAPLWGLGRTIAQEHPESRCALVDLDSAAEQEAGQNTGAEALRHEIQSETGEGQVAFRGGSRFVARLVPYGQGRARNRLQVPEGQPCQLRISRRGSLDNLELAPVNRRPPGADEVAIRVRASGLNFLDVVNALGMLPGDFPIGGECAGDVVAVGEGVDGFDIGDPVIAMAPGAFGQYVTTDANLVAPMPESLDFPEAATIPVVFLTAYYGLYRLANLSPGDKVLIHAAAGGVGLAAVQLAKLAGTEIFATASPPKWDFLRSLGIEHIMNSRTTDFAAEIMEMTGGEGVDVVLNSLTSEGFIERSLSVLGSGGRFVEIGKVNIWRPDEVAASRPDVSYSILDLGRMPEWKDIAVQPGSVSMGMALRELMALFQEGQLKPLPHRVFPLVDAIDAFRYMQQARHMGKIVLIPPADGGGETSAPIRDDGAYLITGGLGGLGLEVAKWMVGEGARHLVLTGRSAPSTEAREIITELEATGAEVRVIGADISDRAQVTRLLEEMEAAMPPLAGIIHAAGVLDDGVLREQTIERFDKVMAPKVAGGWLLHTLTREKPLDFFVCFASMAGLFGSAGQTNYAAANTFLDALSHHRRALGLPTLSIDWGAWARVGLAAAEARRMENVAAMGAGSMEPEEGISHLATLMARADMGQAERAQVAVSPMNWPRFLKRFPVVPTFFAEMAARLPILSAASFLEELRETPPEKQRDHLRSHIQSELNRVLGFEPGQPMDPSKGFTDIGMDSLMVVEARNRLQAGLKCSLPSTVLFKYPSLDKLVNYIASEILALEFSASSESAMGPDKTVDSLEDKLAEIDQLSEEDAKALIDEGLASIQAFGKNLFEE
uniref:Myxalamid-type polyketide synthase MxaB n=1 Tax=Candidatus Kentrum sp. DK TaxID=2126562 RepID=A0A450T049_9GAMM|nr:MAG: myxalamid-type polyketide synthase MxaB [Candidatus Kentron sp. DK]